MFLKKIELKGFKSFADRTSIDLMHGLTCVVGPNGSGKSNITDAIRWVLGEQKVKTLRGSKMEDVIFNGTHRRAALGVAEVSLHFSNEDFKFPIDFSEIVLARRLYRSGESEYLINDTPCRLKDVRDLFTDTGIGTEGYSLIGQGRIESIISGSSEERRMIFEEAAGIVKYKQKKREAMKKLDNTELNLMRLEDLGMELKARLGPLEKESEKAKSFVALSDALRAIEVAVFLSDHDKLTVKLDKVLADYEIVTSEKSALETVLSDNRHQLTELESELEIMDEEWLTLEEERLSLSNEDKTLDGDLALWDEKLRSGESERSRLQEALDQELGEETALEVELKALKEADASLRNIFETQLKIVGEKQHASEKMSEVLTVHEQKTATLRGEVISMISKIERTESEIRHKNEYKAHLTQRITELSEESDSLRSQLDAVELRLKETGTSLSEIQRKREVLSERDGSTEKEVLLYTAKQKQLEGEKRRKELEQSKVSAEKEALENLEKNFEGYDLSVKRLMQDLKAGPGVKGVMGVLAERIQVDPGYETAIEVALGRNSQNVICENENVAKTLIERLKTKQLGRVTFLPLDMIGRSGGGSFAELTGMSGFVGMADSLVRAEDSIRPALSHLIGRTAIFETYEDAVKAFKKTNGRLRLVTIQGEVFNPNGSITGGSKQNQSSGLLSRKNRIDTLQFKIEQIAKEEQTLVSGEKVILEKLESAKGMRSALLLKFAALDTELTELQFRERTLEEDKKRLKERLIRILNEKDEQAANVDQLQKENESLQGQIVTWRLEAEHAEQEVLGLDQKVGGCKTENDALVQT
ncbi:MAG: chromosome segregation protein SMC, partial [Erysipelotrichaceae bacterium]|nr:chromosome segregation protein SMC [Erysipelotrichaceae bacterium]